MCVCVFRLYLHSQVVGSNLQFAAASPTVRLFIAATREPSDLALAGRCVMAATASPAAPLLLSSPFRDYVSKVRNASPWRFGMTGSTNYCSAASSLSPVLSLLCLTHSPQLVIIPAGDEEHFDV